MSLYGSIGGLKGADDEKAKKDDVQATNKWKPNKNILLPAALKRKRAISDLAAKNAALKARLQAQRASKGKGAASVGFSSAKKVKPVTVAATASRAPAPNSIAAIAAGTANAVATAAVSSVEFADEYDPFRPNDFEEWELIFSRDERARRDREQRKELFRTTEKLTQRSRNTAAFAPPQALLADTVVNSTTRARLRGGDQTHPARASQLAYGSSGSSGSGSSAGGLGAKMMGKYVLLLTNMVGPTDDLTDLDDETSTECSGKYGTVVSCKVHLEPRNSCPPEEAVRIFIEFARQDSATQALSDLNGRKFAGRLVQAHYFDLGRFKRSQFAR
eukprot:gene39-1839_t